MSKRRKGLRWKEIIAKRKSLNERRQNYTIIVFTAGLIVITLLVSSIAVMIRSKYLKWKHKHSEDTESVRDFFAKEERRILEKRSEKLKGKNHNED